MAYKDVQRGSHFRHCKDFRRALPPVIFACIALWFLFFLMKHSAPGTPKATISPAKDPRPSGKESKERNTESAWQRSPLQKAFLKEIQQQDQVQEECDLAFGRWVRNEGKSTRKLYGSTCSGIFKGWNCLRNNKSNSMDILSWRWQPWKCDLPQLNASFFLETFKHKSMGFVGDSLNRNMYVSLVCSLKQVPGELRKWRPGGADKAVTFLRYNFTLAYHRTNLLARYGRWEAKADGGALERLGYHEGYRVDVDIPQSSWAKAPWLHHVLILNTGHWWWAPNKFDPVKSPMLFFHQGEPVIPTMTPEEGLDMALENMLKFVEREMPDGLKFLRTQSPRHFEGGEWDQGGICHRTKPLTAHEVDAFFITGPNVELGLANQHLVKAIKGTSFKLLNISYLSSFRADAHPSKFGGKVHEDCMHWCLPGVTDVWNDMLVMQALRYGQGLDTS